MESTILHNVTAEQIAKLFDSLQNQIKELKENFEPKQPTEFLTRSELSKLLKCDLSTIHNWCKKGKITPYGLGNRVYFKRSEIEAVLTPLTIKKGLNHE